MGRGRHAAWAAEGESGGRGTGGGTGARRLRIGRGHRQDGGGRAAAPSSLYGGGPAGAARPARALKEAGHRGRVLATQAVHDPRFLTEAGPSAEGWLIVSTVLDAATASSARARAV
ncbi:hypothetical protein ACFWHQ_19665, partial [Streptomyces sp. NPDC060334]